MSDEPPKDETVEIPLGEVGSGELAAKEQEFFGKLDPEDIRKRKLLNDVIEQDNKHRLDYADKAYGLVQAWVGFLMVLISAQFGLQHLGIALGKEEFIAVVVSLTASMFGFWALVGRYLFPAAKNKDDDKS